MEKFKIFNHIADQTACGAYRCMLPSIKCADYFERNNIPIEIYMNTAIPELNLHFDAYIFHRTPQKLSMYLPIFDLIEDRRNVIWEFDDDLFNIPASSPAKASYQEDILRWVRRSITTSKSVIASTDYLAKSIIKQSGYFSDKIIVNTLPNLINSNHYDQLIRFKRPTNKVVRILWTGSPTHEEDLELIVPAINMLRDRDDIQFIFYGYMPKIFREVSNSISNLIYVGWTDYPSYVPILSYIAPDISLIPCVNSPFNNCKSNIKYLETVLAGAVTIISDNPIHGDIPPSLTFRKVEDSPSLWADAIVECVEFVKHKEEEKEFLLQMSRDFVINNFSWETENNRRSSWINFFMGLAGMVDT